MAECRSRWDEMNKTKKNNSKIGDLPYLKFGCDDITAVVAFFTFMDDLDGDGYNQRYWIVYKYNYPSIYISIIHIIIIINIKLWQP